VIDPDLEPLRAPAPPADRMVCADSVERALLAMASPPARRSAEALRHVPVLGRRGELPDESRRAALEAEAVEQAVPLTQIDEIDAEAVAAWVVSHYPDSSYPAVVLGSPHGAAVHLAVACGAAWLPTSFTVTAPWPGGSATDWVAAVHWGSWLAARILARNPGVTVRQTHDPVLRGPLCGSTVSLHVRWRTVPEAYLRFLTSRLTPGAASVLVRDLRTWPVVDGSPGYSFQIGSPTNGWTAAEHTPDNPGFGRLLRGISAGEWPAVRAVHQRRYAETSGEPALEPELRRIAAGTGLRSHRILYAEGHGLSAAVADLYRSRLRAVGGGRHCAVVTGRMTDPWAVIDAGMVPYWCESSSLSAVETAERWLAGSEPFDTVSVLPDPPGTVHDHIATPAHWRSLVGFGRRGGRVDSLVARRYPLLPPAAGHATRHLGGTAGEPRPVPLPVDEALRRLGETGAATGLLVA
jgi:hypothetical protein